jgi:hypothetical protein
MNPGDTFYYGSPDGGVRIDFGNLEDSFSTELGEGYFYYDRNGVIHKSDVPVTTVFDYNGVSVMARMGPSVSLRLFDELYFQLSAGLALVYLDARITLNQLIDLNLTTEQDVSSSGDAASSDTENQSEALAGYFVEGLFRYQLSPRVGFHAGLMHVSTEELEGTSIGTSPYKLDISKPMLGSAGMSITF